MVDLVGNHRNPETFGLGNEFGKRFCRDNRAGRIGGAGKKHSLQRLFRMCRLQMGGRQIGGTFQLDLHHFEVERLHDVAIGRIARSGDRDPIAGIEHGKESQVEARGRAGRYRDPRRRDVDAVMLGVMCCNRLAQVGPAKGVGVADAAVAQGALRGLAHEAWRRVERLAHGKRDHRRAERLQPVGFRQNVHGVEGLDIPAFGNRNDHNLFNPMRVSKATPHKCPNDMGITSS